MDALHCLKSRRSIRSYRPDPVDPAVIQELLACAAHAPTAFNRQPWTFVVVRDAAMRARLAEATGHAAFLATAPVCVAVFCSGSESWVEDGCAATENLLLAAHAHGLGGCWVSGYQTPHAEAVGRLLGAPAEQRVVSLVAVGHPAESPSVEKRPLADVTRWERF